VKTKSLIALILGLAWGATAQAQFQTAPHDPSNDIDCLDCHTIHGTPLYNYKTVEGNVNLCKSCHNESGVGDINTHSPGGTDLMCSTCHNPHRQDQQIVHGSTFSKLIRENVTTPNSGILPVQLLAATGTKSFADGDGVYDGICEVCHTTTDYHRNNVSGNHLHNVAADCRTCHVHLDGFAPVQSCVGCHFEEKGTGTYAAGTRRRPIVDDPATTATIEGDFQNSIGGHHIGSDPTDFMCAVCHREGIIDDKGTPLDPSDDEVVPDDLFHNAGTAPYTVDLRNVDDATASYPVRTDPVSWPAGSGPNGPYGSPTNVYKNNMTEFCIGCHDGDGASVVYSVDPAAPGSSTDPFGDGSSPLNVFDKFKTTNYSSHAIASQKHGDFGPKYTADWANPGDPGIKAAAFVNGWGSAAVTECADCHLGQDPGGTPSYYHNAHGGRNLEWLMLDRNGLDQDFDHGSSAPDEGADGTTLCWRCHDPTTYTTSESGAASNSRYEKHGQNGHADSSANVFGIGCLNCHGGDTLEPINGGSLVKGGIHGTNRSDAVDLDKSSNPVNPYNRLRFTNGSALDRWTGEAAGASSISCSTQSGTEFGHNISCTQHGNKNQSYTQNYD
jgi:predicted CXXCH cytochrome family protein